MSDRQVHPLAGKPAPPSLLVDVPRLLAAYHAQRPDPAIAAQRVAFGTSGHRGSSLRAGFTEAHILAVTQAICLHRRTRGIDGPLCFGWDTHALSGPARVSALEVLAANGVDVMVDAHDRPTPTPVISQTILAHNRDRTTGLADGIVITPSHNPPDYGGFKYDPPSGGPADTETTSWIQDRANALLAEGLRGVARMPYERACRAATVRRFDYVDAYAGAIRDVIDTETLRGTTLAIGVDPLGGASVGYWEPIAERYGFGLRVVNPVVDPTFAFMTVDWDGEIRMDPSSPFAMARLIGLREQFDVAFAADPDADRHGVVSRSAGLMDPNHYLAVSISLRVLALDLRWSWNHSADELWAWLDPALWALTHNPWAVLHAASRVRLEALLEQPEHRQRVQALLDVRQQYLSGPSWFRERHPDAPLTRVAYVSMEFGLSEVLPIYAGGLGNVAGDHPGGGGLRPVPARPDRALSRTLRRGSGSGSPAVPRRRGAWSSFPTTTCSWPSTSCRAWTFGSTRRGAPGRRAGRAA